MDNGNTLAKSNKPATIKSFWNEKWAKVTFRSETKSSDYEISNFGRIKGINKSTQKEVELNGTVVHRGFRILNVKLKNGRSQSIFIHKFVAETFVENNDETKQSIIHKDGDKLNNRWGNLEWATKEELYQFQVEHGVFDNTRKSLRERSKMTEAKVILLKKWLKEGKTKKKILAKRMGISYMQLNRIERGENWGHVQIDGENQKASNP